MLYPDSSWDNPAHFTCARIDKLTSFENDAEDVITIYNNQTVP